MVIPVAADAAYFVSEIIGSLSSVEQSHVVSISKQSVCDVIAKKPGTTDDQYLHNALDIEDFSRIEYIIGIKKPFDASHKIYRIGF